MPKIDSLDTKAVVSARSLKRRSTDAEVKKAVADNLKGMSSQELHGHVDSEGQTCVQRLVERKRLNKADAKQYPLGATFYKDRMTLHIPIRDPSQPVCGNC